MVARPHEVDDLRRAEDVSRQLMQLGLTGADTSTLLNSLATMLDAPCALVTAGGRLLASGIGGTDGDVPPEALMSALLASDTFARVRSVDPVSAMGRPPMEEAVSLGAETVHQLVAPVIEGGRLSNVLAVWIRGALPRDWQRLAIQHTATVIAFSSLRDRSQSETAQDVLQDLVTALMRRDLNRVAAIEGRLSRCGLDVDAAHVPVVLARRGDRPLDARVVERVRERLRKAGARGGAAGWENRVVALVAVPPELPSKQQERWGRTLAGELALAVHPPRRDAVAGVGPVCRGLARLAAGLQSAWEAAEIGSRLAGDRQVYEADATWFYSALLHARDAGHLDSSWRRLLRDLAVEDERSGGMLLVTLDAFFDCQQSYTETARYLYVHPNTVRYRLQKIKRVIGNRPFEDPLHRIAYHMALKAALLFGQGSRTRGSESASDAAPYVRSATSGSMYPFRTSAATRSGSRSRGSPLPPPVAVTRRTRSPSRNG